MPNSGMFHEHFGDLCGSFSRDRLESLSLMDAHSGLNMHSGVVSRNQ